MVYILHISAVQGQTEHVGSLRARLSSTRAENNSIKPLKRPCPSIFLLLHLALRNAISHTQWKSDLFRRGVVSSPAPAISLMDNPGILDTHMFVWTCGRYHSLIRNPTQNLCKKILIFFQITHFFQLFPPAKWLPLGIHKNNFSQSNPFLID